MEVSTTVSRYKYLSQEPEQRKARAKRVKVKQIDFKKGSPTVVQEFLSSDTLTQALLNGEQTKSSVTARVYVVEDLSRAMIEAFGNQFDIDPHFFRGENLSLTFDNNNKHGRLD